MTSAELQKLNIDELHPNISVMVPVSWLARDIPVIEACVVATPPASMEMAKTMRPPVPPVETVKGYNSVMDEPRPTRIENYLR